MASTVSKPRGDTSMQQGRRADLMNSGSGTPWEDRGQLGLVGAYFKTLILAFSKPAQLFGEMRRPDSTGDATSFAFICGLWWSLGTLIRTWMVVHSGKWDDTGASPWMNGIIIAVLAPFAAVAIARLAGIVFGKLISTELRATDAPQVLLFNLFAYCAAPSIFVVIPFIGVPIASVWIFVLMLTAAIKRLGLKVGGSIINTVLTGILCAACAAVIYFGVNFLSGVLWKAWFG
jgi:hypothetical protein